MAGVDWKSQLAHKIVCAVILEREGKFLMLELANGGREYEAEGKWTNPGARIHKGETFHDTIKRSMAEKLNIKVELKGLIGLYQYLDAHEGYDVLRIVFKGEIVAGEPKAGERIKDIKWLDFEDLKYLEDQGKLLNPFVVEAVKDYLAGKSYPLEIIHDF